MRTRRRLFFVGPAALAALALLSPSPAARADNQALLVGVESYKTVTFDKLHYPENDAEELMKVLTRDDSSTRFDVTILTTGQNRNEPGGSALSEATPMPNKDTILRSLDRVCDAASDPSSTLIVFLSGHGKSILQPDGSHKSFFCPYDIEKIDNQTFANAIDIEKEIAARMNQCNAGSKYLFIDACRDRASKGDGPTFKIPKKLRFTATQVHIMFSCSDDQKSEERDDLKHGIFSYYLIQGLKGFAADNEEVRIDGLFRYVREGLRKYAKKNDLASLQKPEWIRGPSMNDEDVVAKVKPLGSGGRVEPGDPDQFNQRFENKTFSGEFAGVNFGKAQFINCRFGNDCKFSNGTVVSRAEFVDCIFEGADFRSIDTRNMIVKGQLPLSNNAPWDPRKKPRVMIGEFP